MNEIYTQDPYDFAEAVLSTSDPMEEIACLYEAGSILERELIAQKQLTEYWLRQYKLITSRIDNQNTVK